VSDDHENAGLLTARPPTRPEGNSTQVQDEVENERGNRTHRVISVFIDDPVYRFFDCLGRHGLSIFNSLQNVLGDRLDFSTKDILAKKNSFQ
jgi:hypothetical protein